MHPVRKGRFVLVRRRLFGESLEDRRLLAAAVGDFVWHDLNANGLQDASEPGIAGAVVEVFSSVDGTVGNVDDVAGGVTITDAKGQYRLAGLTETANYYLVFRAPVGYTFTTAHVGSDAQRDSDADARGATPMFKLSAGQDNLTLDAGLVGTAPGFGFALQAGPTGGRASGSAVTRDAAGNIYLTGWFHAPAVPDGSLTEEILVAKYSAAGAMVWTRSVGGPQGDRGNAIVVGPDGSVYTTGIFQGTADFDPGPNQFLLTGGQGPTAFLWKLDAAGDFVWARALGASDSSGWGVALAPDGAVITTGVLNGSGAFVSKLDAAGNPVWTTSLSSDGLVLGNSVAVSEDGSVYTTGDFMGTVDFAPSDGPSSLTSVGDRDAFVSKQDAKGNFLWARSFGGTGTENGNSVAVSADGQVFATGGFEDTADFDPGAGTFPLTSAGNFDVFVAHLDPTGELVWARSVGGAGSDAGTAITWSADGSVYTTGIFEGTVDFDPVAEMSLTSAGAGDIFVSKLNGAGNSLWARAQGGPGDDIGYGLVVSADGHVYTTGLFQQTVDFDPGLGTFPLTAAGQFDLFLSKLVPGWIRGQLFEDLNGDGVRQSGEPGLGNQLIQLFQETDGVAGLSAGDLPVGLQTTSLALHRLGQYEFAGVGPGTYYVRTPLPAPWQSTLPGPPGYHRVTNVGGQDLTSLDFGVFASFAISGRKFNDQNGDGSGLGDPGLGGVTIYLDNDSSGSLTAGDTQTTTGTDGTYRFDNLGPRAEGYVVREAVPPNATQTSPTSGSYVVAAVSGQDAPGQDFGDFAWFAISGRKFDDRNGDGNGLGDPGLGGVTIYLDNDHSGSLTAGDTPTTTGTDGTYRFDNLGPRAEGYVVREAVPANATQTSPTSGSYLVAAVSGQDVPGQDFGDFAWFAISGRKFDDRNGDGSGLGDPGLSGVTIYLDNDNSGSLTAGDTQTTTGTDGTYRFDNLGPRAEGYVVREAVPANATQTSPTSGSYLVAAASGQDVPGQDFGDFALATIRGMKFADLNGNGQQDDGEPGLDGWTIELIDNRTGQLVARTTTAAVDRNNDGSINPATERGHYNFADVGLGSYLVREVQRLGWEQTAPRKRFEVTQTLGSGTIPSSLTSADVDGDGDPDLIAANRLSGDISVFLNEPGSFGSATNMAVGSRPQAVAAADVNHDGLLDLIVAQVGDALDSTDRTGAIAVLLGRGDGTFRAPQPYLAGDGPIDVAVADLNGDGSLDLAVANFRSDDVSVLFNDGQGQFVEAARLPVPPQPVSVAAADLNGDGHSDLAVASFLADRVTIWLNNTAGSFSEAAQLPTGGGPSDVVVGDLDRHGKSALIVANYLANTVSVFRNDGAGSFPTRTDFPVGAGPRSVALGDGNGDGYLDLLIANSDADTVTLLLDDGGGQFIAAGDFQTGRGPASLVAGDWNDDGALDVATANTFAGTVSVLTQGSGSHLVQITFSGEVREGLDFGNQFLYSESGVDVAAESEPSFQNAQDRFDVNTDGAVTPRDALLLINALNQGGSRSLPERTGSVAGEGETRGNRAIGSLAAETLAAHAGRLYVDVNGDQLLSPIDALLVINRLNQDPAGEGEAQSVAAIQEATGAVRLGDTVRLGDNGKTTSAFALRPLTPTPVYRGEKVVLRPRPGWTDNRVFPAWRRERTVPSLQPWTQPASADSADLETLLSAIGPDVAAAWRTAEK